MNHIVPRVISAFCSCLMVMSLYAGGPLWVFKPLTDTSFAIPANSTAVVQYRVTNQSKKPHVLTMNPIQGITQITIGNEICGKTFALPGKGTSCILSLLVNGSQLTHTIADGPIVCEQRSTNLCYRPKQSDILQISVAPPITDAIIRVTGSPLTLTTNGPTGYLTINNTSLEVSATNITSNFTGTALAGHVTETGNNCTNVAPNSSCTLTYTPGNTAVAPTNFSIQGTNTNTLTARMTINIPAPTLTSVSPNAGTSLGGASVTLTGTNFTDASSVTFDGLNATNLTVLNATTVTVDTPAHAAGTVDVVITTPSGTATLPASYTYQLPPALTLVTPASGTASGNAGVTLQGSNLTGTTSVTFDGISATNVNVVNANTVTAVTPAHAAGVVEVIVTTPSGSSALPNGYTYIATAVGQASGGGTIACLGGGSNNLIAASADHSVTIQWGGSGTATGAQNTSDGATNTTAIVNCLTNGNAPCAGGIDINTYAAGICSIYEVDSQGNSPCLAGNACYNDWFLPAVNQLSCLYTNRVAIGGFSATFYWTSTEASGGNATTWARYQHFDVGTQNIAQKTSNFRVRCVRNFSP